MKFLFLFLSFLSINLYSQSVVSMTEHTKSILNNWPSMELNNKSDNIKGSPYLHSEFKPVTIVSTNGKKYSVKGNIDIYKNEFIYEDEASGKLFIAENLNLFDYLTFAGRKFIYKEHDEGMAFFEVYLEKEGNMVLKNYKKYLQKKKSTYNGFIPAQYKDAKDTFFIYHKKSDKLIPVFKSYGKFAKELGAKLGKNKKEVKQYLKDIYFDIDNINTLQLLLDYLDK